MAPNFPERFVWGTATAAYQIEGAAAEDGRGPSIWDTFSHTPGRVANGDTGDIACDHYHRYREDVAILAQLGVDGYRFSISWPRVQPGGTGATNPAGIAFYDRLIDELLAAGIAPWATLYHWDLPQQLEDAGGWPVRETAQRFADHAAAMVERFGDRITHWTTLNEPWCSAFLGYLTGVHAPGRRDPAAALRAAHHLLLGHGWATDAMRAARSDRSYGITLNLYPVDPATDSEADERAARRVDNACNRIFTDPVLAARYPADMVAELGPLWPAEAIGDDDLSAIATPVDFVGVNYYTRHTVAAVPPRGPDDVSASSGWIGCEGTAAVGRGLPRTTMGWEIDPAGLHDVLTRLSDRYPGLPPIYITENGASFDDVIAADGAVHDEQRVAFLERHFHQAAALIAAGIDLRGYFVWSLLDNFEWSLGYSRRFGVVHVDFDTGTRTIKDSGHYLARVARQGL